MKQQTFQLYYPHGCNTWRTHSAPWRKLKKNYTSMNHPFVPKPKKKKKKIPENTFPSTKQVSKQNWN